MIITCCKGCLGRHTNCWSSCGRYLAEKAEYQKEKAYTSQHIYYIRQGSFLGDEDLSYLYKKHRKAK